MGVMACYRRNCENIMCDRYSTEHGYICYECFEELVDTGPATDVKEFMNSPKKTVTNEREAAEFRYDKLFPE